MSTTEWHWASDAEGWTFAAGGGSAQAKFTSGKGHDAVGSIYLANAMYFSSYAYLNYESERALNNDTITLWGWGETNWTGGAGNVGLTIVFTDASVANLSATFYPRRTWQQATFNLSAYNGKTIEWMSLFKNAYGALGYPSYVYIDDFISTVGFNWTPPTFRYILRTDDQFATPVVDITPPGKGALNHRGLLASVQAKDNVVALVGVSSSSTRDLAVSDDAGVNWAIRQTGLVDAVDIAGWDIIFFAKNSAPMLNINNGVAGYDIDCTGDWLQVTGNAFADPVRVAVVW